MRIRQYATMAVLAWLTFCTHEAQAFYNPQAGRWLNRDPLEEKGGKNLHAFVQNRPIQRFDRLGLMALSHLGKGFQFDPDDKLFWLGIYARFDREDYLAIGGAGNLNVQAYVASRAMLTWSNIRRCCDTRRYSGSSRMFFLDVFSLTSGGQVAGGGRATPLLTDGKAALLFNPINTTATELRNCSAGGASDLTGDMTGLTEGTISLVWSARLLKQVDGISDGFSSAGMGGDTATAPAPFGVEANHKLFFVPESADGSDGPTAWTMAAEAGVSYRMTFQWSECDAAVKKRRFMSSPVLPTGEQRPGRGPHSGAEFYREPYSAGF